MTLFSVGYLFYVKTDCVDCVVLDCVEKVHLSGIFELFKSIIVGNWFNQKHRTHKENQNMKKTFDF